MARLTCSLIPYASLSVLIFVIDLPLGQKKKSRSQTGRPSLLNSVTWLIPSPSLFFSTWKTSSFALLTKPVSAALSTCLLCINTKTFSPLPLLSSFLILILIFMLPSLLSVTFITYPFSYTVGSKLTNGFPPGSAIVALYSWLAAG